MSDSSPPWRELFNRKAYKLPRWARWIAWPLGVLAFVVGLAAAAVLHLNLPAARDAARDITETSLSRLLAGSIEIGQISRLEAGGFTARQVEVRDPQGRPVLRVGQLSVQVDLLSIIERVLGPHPKITVEIEDVGVSDVDVFIIETVEVDEKGRSKGYPSIADAFTPAEPSPDDSSRQGRPVRVWLPDVKLRRVFARGSLSDSPTLEARIEEADARVLATDRGASIDISRFDLLASGIGGVDTEARGEIHIRAPGGVWGDIVGFLGAIPIEQKFRFEPERVTIDGQIPVLEPSAVRAIFPEWPLDQPIAIENHVVGRSPRFEVTGIVRAGEGRVLVDGVAHVAPGLEADLDLDVENVDLARLNRNWPTTNLELRSAAEVWDTGRGPHFELNATLLPSSIEQTPLPVVDFRLNYDERGVVGDATLHEQGLPAHAEIERPPGGPLAFDLSLRKTRLENSPRLSHYTQAVGQIEGGVKGEVAGTRVSLQADISGAGLARDAVSIATARLTGTAAGDLTDLEKTQLGLELQAGGFRAGPVELTTLQADVSGPILEPQVKVQAEGSRGATLDARATTRTDRVQVRGFEGTLSGTGKDIKLDFDLLSYVDERLILEDFDLSSEGQLHVDLNLKGNQGQVQLRGRGLNIARIEENLSGSSRYGGRLDADVDLILGAESSGTVEFAVRDGKYQGVDGIQLAADLTVDGRTTQGTLEAGVDGLVQAKGQWNVRLGGPFLELDSYQQATGAAQIAVTDLDLATLGMVTQLASDVVPVAGKANLQLELDRSSANLVPQVKLSGRTRQLELRVEGGNKTVHVAGVDLALSGSIDSGSEEVTLVARAVDSLGDVASASGSIELPLQQWLDQPPTPIRALSVAVGSPLEVVVAVPERRVSDFPRVLPIPPLTGAVSARGILRGSYEAPDLSLTVQGRDLRGDGEALTDSIDTDLTLRYQKNSGALAGAVKARQAGRQVGTVTFDMLVPFEHLLNAPAEGTPLWRGSAQVVLDGAPLGLVAPLAQSGVAGDVQGAVTVQRSELMPVVTVNLRLRHLEAAGRALGDGEIMADTQGNRLLARAQFNDEYGKLSGTGEVSLTANTWGALPSVGQPIFVTVESDSYDAAVLSPAVTDLFSELSGSLHGQLRLELTPPAEGESEWKTTFSGQASMREGILTPKAMGLRLEDTRLRLDAAPEGQFNVVRLTDFAAKARSDKENVKGSAVGYFDGTELVRAEFNLTQSNFPLTAAGTKLADLTGTVSGRLALHNGELQVALDLPRMNVVLPTRSDELIELSDNPTVEILQPIAKPEEDEVDVDSTPIRMRLRLGDQVRVQNQILNLGIDGAPELYFAQEMFVSGRIGLKPGGRIQVLGRQFVVDYGALLFDNPDPANPHLDVSAVWRAPNSVLVRATVTGTVKDPILEWSSEPPLPGGEAEVVALVLGGGGNSQGAGIAYAAALVNEAIGQTGFRGVELYASTQSAEEGQGARLSERQWDSYTAAVQVSDELWFEGTYRTESAGPGSETRSGLSGTLDWRFHPNWSARTEVGMLGVGLDLLWQYRY